MNRFVLPFWLVIFYFTCNIQAKPTEPIDLCLSCAKLVNSPSNSSFFHEDIANWCASNEICSRSAKAGRVKSLICSECLTITNFIQDKVADYQTEEEIAEFIKNDVCGKLPNPVIKETCQSFMVEYGDSFVYKIALKIFDPVLVCSKELKVCPQTVTTNKLIKELFYSRALDKFAESSCDLCIELVTKMETLISSPTSNVNLTDDFLTNQVCSHFKSKKATRKCTNMLDAFGSHFVQMIGYNVPRKICTSVDICYNRNFHLLGGQKCTFGPAYWCHTTDHAVACKATNFCEKNVWKPLATKVSSSIQNMPQCLLCHLLLNVIDKELKKNKTVEQIEATLDTVCQKVYKDQTKLKNCQEHVAKYTKRFIELATQGVAPEVVCVIFGFCQFGKYYENILQGGQIPMYLCKSLIGSIYQSLSGNKGTRKEIVKALENSCTTIPESKKQVCSLYITIFEDELIQLITETADADKVAQNIGLCSVVGSAFNEKAGGPDCILCEKVFEFIFFYLQKIHTQEAINDALDKVCNQLFPFGHKKSCRKFVDNYTAQIIDIILQTSYPKEACGLLGMCKQST